jgi:hypothetical protein
MRLRSGVSCGWCIGRITDTGIYFFAFMAFVVFFGMGTGVKVGKGANAHETGPARIQFFFSCLFLQRAASRCYSALVFRVGMGGANRYIGRAVLTDLVVG